MGYIFTETIKECIDTCVKTGKRTTLRKEDQNGNPYVWLTADWVVHDEYHEVVEIQIRDCETGRVFYKTEIPETITAA